MSTQNEFIHYQRKLATWVLAGFVVLATLCIPMMLDGIADAGLVSQAHACQHGGGGC